MGRAHRRAAGIRSRGVDGGARRAGRARRRAVIPTGVEVFVGLEPIDLRWSFDRLSGIVEERIGRSARSGALFIFFGGQAPHGAEDHFLRRHGNGRVLQTSRPLDVQIARARSMRAPPAWRSTSAHSRRCSTASTSSSRRRRNGVRSSIDLFRSKNIDKRIGHDYLCAHSMGPTPRRARPRCCSEDRDARSSSRRNSTRAR